MVNWFQVKPKKTNLRGSGGHPTQFYSPKTLCHAASVVTWAKSKILLIKAENSPKTPTVFGETGIFQEPCDGDLFAEISRSHPCSGEESSSQINTLRSNIFLFSFFFTTSLLSLIS